jgi:Arc/MetJ family transcription regulator
MQLQIDLTDDEIAQMQQITGKSDPTEAVEAFVSLLVETENAKAKLSSVNSLDS